MMEGGVSLTIVEGKSLITRGDSILVVEGLLCWRDICWNWRIRSWTLGRLLVSAWFGGDFGVAGWTSEVGILFDLC